MNPSRFFLLVFLFLQPIAVFSNAAMPGVWQGGAGARFVPLYPSDSSALQSISMQREEVLVHLCNGYAVVKGTYWMHNRSDSALSIVVGYPVQGTVNAPIVNHINLGEPRSLKVLVNGQTVEITKGVADLSGLIGSTSDHTQFDPEKWILWKTEFAPASITTITVYFLVNCSEARLRKGYNVKKGHAFAYVLESGKAWLGSIDTGSIKIKLQEGLKPSRNSGLLPSDVWQANNDLLSWQFNSLEPSEKSNVLVWYNVGEDSIYFERDVVPRYQSLFDAIDKFDLSEFERTDSWPKIKKGNLSAGNGLLTSFTGVFMLVFFLPLAVVAGLFIFWRRRKGSGKMG
jgi:hypothetical protein